MNILNLSDIHFGRNYKRYKLKDDFSKHDLILDELIDNLKNLDESLKPEHILFTGDITWRGKYDEYEEAYAFFTKLLEALNLTGKDISFCVGNHDIERNYKCIDDDINNYSIDKIDKYYEYENINLFEPLINEYNTFCERLGVIPYSYPYNDSKEYSYTAGYKDITFRDGNIIRLISFNTSMLQSQSNISSDKLWLGKPQIDAMRKHGIIPSPKDICYTISLFHHSDRFLHPNETNTYDGRTAPLPTMLEYSDLMLCGHSESWGKPRLTRQRGGGQLLLNGATYYNDEHQNSFSLLFINPNKKSFGFVPYVYDNGWNDYIFDKSPQSEIAKNKLHKTGELLDNIKLICNGKVEYTININRIEINDNNFSNQIDINNPFRITNNNTLTIELAPFHINRISSIDMYHQFSSNTYNNFKLIDSNNNIILETDNAIIKPLGEYDYELIKDLRFIEKALHLSFRLNDNITKLDRYAISVLTNLIKNNYYEYEGKPKKIVATMSKEQLEKVYELAIKNNNFYLYHQGSYQCFLLYVDIKIDNAYRIKGPYQVDVKLLKDKIDSYQEGDIRKLEFIPSGKMQSKIMLDKKFIEPYLNDSSKSLLDFSNIEFEKIRIK